MKNGTALGVLIQMEFVLAIFGLATDAAPVAASRMQGGLWLLVAASSVLGWVGILYRMPAAREVYLASWIGYLVLMSLRGGVVDTGIGQAAQLLMALVGGGVLALLYLGDPGGLIRERVAS